jgi:hypothetical protein
MHIWPFDQLADARKKFKHDKAAIVEMRTKKIEDSFADGMPPELWEFIHQFLHLVPSEIAVHGGRMKIQAGSGETFTDEELAEDDQIFRNYN